MTIRLSLLALACVAANAVALAPAPVYRERPDHALLTRMLGKWEATGVFAKNNLTPIVIIAKDTWTFTCPENSPPGQGVKLPPRRIQMNSRRIPATLDLEPSEGSTLWTWGIVKLEGDRLIYCFRSGEGKEPVRPPTFPRD